MSEHDRVLLGQIADMYREKPGNRHANFFCKLLINIPMCVDTWIWKIEIILKNPLDPWQQTANDWSREFSKQKEHNICNFLSVNGTKCIKSDEKILKTC